MKYLQRYAEMDCPIITEISIVWNNEQSMEALGVFARKDRWKRPVRFFRTPHNSMNWRYKVAEGSTSQVFFSIDDDITVGCQELTKGFEVWKQHALGSIGPIVSYGPRHYTYQSKEGFQYGRGPNKDHFNIGLVGLAFLSRHFMELYYSELFEVREMRNYIVEKNNCDDIGLNWVVQYFYPELPTLVISGDIQNISPRIAQATSQNHYPFRSQCIDKFTEIFGVNSLRYLPIVDRHPGKEKRLSPLKAEIVLAKKHFLQEYAIKGNLSFKPHFTSSPVPTSTSNDTLHQQLQGLQEELAILLDQQAKTRAALSKLSEEEAKSAQNRAESISSELQWRLYLELVLAVVVVLLLWRYLWVSRELKKARQVRVESREADSEVVVLQN